MYLKTIEVQGFKSFAQKILFQFHNGVTGIVGPNGSGKSNVADAVRWVLGEQSAKQLRSSNMQDVIFAGTENRKPQGYAYVAITFDNTDRTLSYDSDEVTVSRRVYRSGESEYQLNHAGCRLKDIQELFYDTGIGKEGYSIIGQGQIDKILSTKPEERRELFDEAAGIVKYKKRKAAAVKKLENEQQNLVRVNDILMELEKQVGPLGRQAEKAKQYLGLKEQLKTLEINQFLILEEKRREQLSGLEQNMDIVQQDVNGAKLNAEMFKKRHEELEQKREELDQEIAGDREALHQATLSKESLEGRIGILQEQIHTEESKEAHVKARMEAIEEEQKGRRREKEGFVGQKAAINGQLDELDDKQTLLEERLTECDDSIRAMDFTISSEKEQMLRAMNEKADLQAKQQRYETMLEQCNIRQSEVNGRLLKQKSEEAVQKEQTEELRKALEEIEKAGKELVAELDGCEEAAARQEGVIAGLSRDFENSQREYHMTSSRLDSLQNLAERYEGYGNSVKRVMEERGRYPGIVGVVADLLTVDKKYETAIETALGGSIQNIVTRDEQTAKELITFLKKNRYGRATFLPLSAISGGKGFGHQEALKEPGVIGTADSLVTAKEGLTVLTEYLLGKILVVNDMDHALTIARKYRYSFRMVTLEGELLNAGGSITGGAYKNASNLLGRKRELSELADALKQCKASMEELKGQLSEARERKEELLRNKETIQESLQKKQLEKNTAALKLRQAEEKLKEQEQENRDLLLEAGQLSRQLQDIEEEKQAILSQAEELEQQKEAHNASMDDASGKLEAMREKREGLSKEFSEVQLQFSTLSQKDAFLLENIVRINGEMEKGEAEYRSLKEELSQAGQTAGELTSEIEHLKEEIVKTQETMENLSRQVERAQERKEQKLLEQKGFFDKREELLTRINDLEKELIRLETQKEKAEEQSSRQVEYLWEEYGLTPSEAAGLKDASLDSLPKLNGQISELKGSIKALGNVNVNAIEDYKEVSERYTFLKTQHDDLIQAADSLKQVIESLEEGMRAQFTEKFQEIKVEFDRVFKELFGGGKGSLELLESEDVLEAGIQIIAQPPGKKLQNMMQLSGGEKALTAISLLFAIQQLKPSPFCLLDEIEAALDDVNVNRFAKYLDKLKERIQFIVITHRRGTMLIADRLYGITMQEKGVSSLVSVDMAVEASVGQKD